MAEIRDVLLTHVAAPALLLFVVARYKPLSRVDGTATIAVVVSGVAFLWLAGRWHLASVWLRHALPIVALGVSVLAFIRARRLPLYASKGVRSWVLRAVKLVLILFLSERIASAIAGRGVDETPITLDFPLRGGTFYIGQGGSTAAVNYHVRNRTQRYALDIVKLNAAGNRGARLYPRMLTEYATFGTPVHAPCTGWIQAAEPSLRDNEASQRDNTRPAGNHILLRCATTDVDVLLAHLQFGSVRVRAGEQVLVGAQLAAVGNSGNSTEPHLHIHAKRGGSPASWREGEGVPMLFNGHFLTRNAIIRR